MEQLELFKLEPFSIKCGFTDSEDYNQQFCHHHFVLHWGKNFERICRYCGETRSIDPIKERYLLEEQIRFLERNVISHETLATRTKNRRKAKAILEGANDARCRIAVLKELLAPPVNRVEDTSGRDDATGGDTNTGEDSDAIASPISTPPVKKSLRSKSHLAASGCIQIRKSQGKYPQAFYHWEEWQQGQRVKHSKYIPKAKLDHVRAAIGRKESVEAILKLLVGK
jgi:hypothetical protein